MWGHEDQNFRQIKLEEASAEGQRLQSLNVPKNLLNHILTFNVNYQQYLWALQTQLKWTLKGHSNGQTVPYLGYTELDVTFPS